MIMKTNNETIGKGFVLAGITNITGVLLSSHCFTNPTIAAVDTVVMSNFGLLMIVIWGLAYISVFKIYDKVKWLVGVFAVEKFIYGFVWTKWMLNNNLSNVFEMDKSAGLFYATYGINDWVFFIFFSLVFICLTSSNK